MTGKRVDLQLYGYLGYQNIDPEQPSVNFHRRRRLYPWLASLKTAGQYNFNDDDRGTTANAPTASLGFSRRLYPAYHVWRGTGHHILLIHGIQLYSVGIRIVRVGV